MALSTSGSPLYGGSTLVVMFAEDVSLSTEKNYYIVYEGSKQRHLTTARRLAPNKLHSIIPGHKNAEEVKLSVVEFSDGDVKTLSSSTFKFYAEGAYYLAQFLVESICSTEALEDLELIKSEHFSLADEDLPTLDKRLSRALTCLTLPDWWSILGGDSQNNNPEPRESLLHFAARLGLTKVASFFLRKSGSEQALKLHNRHGLLPKDVALANGHHGLAELLSEYNVQSLMPLGGWFETGDGLVQTQETGDVTLTSNLNTHQRTIAEDIIVLQGLQKLSEDKDISRQWQTDWPSGAENSESSKEHSDTADDRYKEIIDKVQEIPNVLNLETINDYRDGDGTYTDPNLESSPADDNVDMNDDCDVAMETESLPKLHVSEGEDDMDGIMEGTLASLRGYNEHLLRIRQKSTVFNKILEQDLRKENLARFSTSCPSLDVECRNSPLPAIDEAELCKSMVDLAEDNAGEKAATLASSLCSGEVFSSGPDVNNSADNIHIVVDGVTTESSSDFGLQTQEYDQFLKDYYSGNVPRVRRRSPNPAKDGDAEDLEDSMLINSDSRGGLSPAQDESTDESFQSQEDISSPTDNQLMVGNGQSRRMLCSTGDIENKAEEVAGKNKEMSVSDAGRGSGNRARYSADIEQMVRSMKNHHSGSSLEKMAGSTHSTGSGSDNDSMSHGKISKAYSMSSIPAATNNDKKGSYKDNKHAQFHRQEEIVEEDIPDVNLVNNRTKHRQKPQLSLLDFLNDSTNFTNDSSNIPSPKQKEKEDKKRKTSVFSRFHSSYRIKKNKDKEGKSKASTHRFVSVSFSNNTTCDVCHKPLTNKPALRCQICLVNVHDSSCKEHINACDKGKPKSQIPRQSSAESETVPGYQNNAPSGAPSLRPSYSFKDNTTRTQSAYIGASTQPVPLSAIPQELQQETIIFRKRKSGLQSASAQIQRRSMPNPSRAIVEEDQVAENVSRLELGHSNITETISRSIESLDDVDSVQEVRYDDVELGKLDVDEPETWSETVDKKVLKKLNPKDIKRQDTIWELIQTERHYCKRLKTLQIFFRDGMLKDLQMDPRWVNRLFPHLDDLTHVHMNFLRELQDLQNRRPDKFIEDIGHTLKEQFSGESSNQMKASYGAFCSGHLEAVQLYKNLMEKKNFQMFIKSRMNHPLCKKREIPDFILLITQRPTKYPTLIEAVIKSTKDKKDRENLLSALELSKEVLQNVNAQVEAAERAMRLKDICNRLDSRSFAVYKGNKKFKKSDILSGGRRLLHEGMIGWRNARGKSVEVLAVVLTDVLFFLQENNQKYSFFSQDNKFGVVSLFNLLVREKRDTRDTIGMYLISQDKKNPEMYEIVFNTMTEMQKWAKILRAAVENCPEEEEEVPTEAEVERKRIEERAAKAQAIIEKLHEKDEEIRRCCNAKNKLMVELLSVYNDTDDSQSNSRPSSRDFDETQEMAPIVNAGTLQAALEEVSARLNSLLQEKNSSLSRSVSSVGEHSSNTFPSIPVPKRAETFAGFDNNYDRAKVRSNGDAPDYASDTLEVAAEHDISDPDLASPYTESSPGQLKNLDEESGRGSSYSNLSTVSKLSPMSNPSQDPANIAHLLRTLDTIVYLTANQGTAVESLRAQLAEANERINKLSADVHEKKSGYRHNQLEELRNLQGVIQKEKEDWELKKTREQRDMEQERAQIDEMKRHLEKQEADIKQQKEELNKKREVLQRQMDLLRRSGQLPKDTSLSDLEAADQTDISVQSTSDFVPGHRRSASAELFNANGSETKKSSATKENNFRPENKSVTKLQSFSFGSKQKLPDHLLSATNEQKIGSKNVQQLPSKLLAGGTVSTSPQQGANSGSQKTSPGGTSLGHANQSSPTIALEHVHADLSHSSSTGQIGQVQGPLGSSIMVPKGNRQSNRPKPSPVSGGLSGVLKLAEKGDKKSKSSNSSSQSGDKGAQGAQSPPQEDKKSQQQQQKSGTSAEKNPQIIHKSQKSDSDVIYF